MRSQYQKEHGMIVFAHCGNRSWYLDGRNTVSGRGEAALSCRFLLHHGQVFNVVSDSCLPRLYFPFQLLLRVHRQLYRQLSLSQPCPSTTSSSNNPSRKKPTNRVKTTKPTNNIFGSSSAPAVTNDGVNRRSYGDEKLQIPFLPQGFYAISAASQPIASSVYKTKVPYRSHRSA